MEKLPGKFLYIYLEDADTNPKIRFNLCYGLLLPDKRRAQEDILLSSMKTKEDVLSNYKALDYIGFMIILRVLSDFRIKKRKECAMLAYINPEGRANSIFLDEVLRGAGDFGAFHTFIPLLPFVPGADDNPNIKDDVLHMRVGRIVVNALFDDDISLV